MENQIEAHIPTVSWPTAFLRIVLRVDKSKLNSLGMVVRNSAAVALPLGIGIAIGHPLGAVAVTTGALNVAYSDGHDPYAQRARRMLIWSFLGAFAVFLGSVTGNYHLLAIVVASGWALVAGLLVSISGRAADLGLNTLVTLIVYAARGAMSPKGAFYAGLLVLAGGLLQTACALLSWPLKRYSPERRAIGRLYLDLAEQVKQHPENLLSVPLQPPSPEVQDTISALGRDHSPEGERFRLLYDQAERLRFSVYSVSRLQVTARRELHVRQTPESEVATKLEQILDAAQQILRCVGESLLEDSESAIQPELLEQLQLHVRAAQTSKKQSGSALATELAAAADVMAGQLRVVAQLANSTTTAGAEEFARREFAPPLKLQVRSWLATLRANLHLQSPALRHGIRLAICVAIGDTIGRTINTQRNYWLPMTVAVVLKPDFTTTISRGVLRLGGTFVGLLLATALYHLFTPTALAELILVGLFTFLLRYVGPANYGIFSVAVSGLIVFLIGITGVPPAEVVGQRAINTAAGGLFALLAYALWPTWERSQVSDVMAEMIDRSRDYFRAVAQAMDGSQGDPTAQLDRTRDAWRQARSNAEASVDRLSSEPGAQPARMNLLTSMLASSHAFVRMTMSLEAGLAQKAAKPLLSEFAGFAHDVEFTLYYLSAALRGSQAASQTLPQLREDHRRLVDAYQNLALDTDHVLIETDRLTVALNTLREQVMRYVSLVESVPAQPPRTSIE